MTFTQSIVDHACVPKLSYLERARIHQLGKRHSIHASNSDSPILAYDAPYTLGCAQRSVVSLHSVESRSRKAGRFSPALDIGNRSYWLDHCRLFNCCQAAMPNV